MHDESATTTARQLRRRIALSLTTLVGITGIALIAQASFGQSSFGQPSHGRPVATRPAATTPRAASAPVVVAIGDSIMKGNGLSPDKAWPALLGENKGWDLTNLACNGAGFEKVGDTNDCASDFSALVAQAVALDPSIVIISGSSNDLGISNATLLTRTLQEIGAIRSALPHAAIIGVSTVWGDTLPPAQIADIDDQVKEAIADAGGLYLDIGQPLAEHREWLQRDDVHPTAQGQQVLLAAIEKALPEAVPAP